MNRPTNVFCQYGFVAWTGTALLCLHIAMTVCWSSGTLVGGGAAGQCHLSSSSLMLTGELMLCCEVTVAEL
jgi:hypothetical protein